MATIFALVASYQYYENYAFDADGNPIGGAGAHWKPKGGHEAVIAEGITVLEATRHSPDYWRELVVENGPKDNDFAEFDLRDWELVELNSALVAEVAEFIDEMAGDDIDFVRYRWGGDKGTEFAFDWALAQMDKEGV